MFRHWGRRNSLSSLPSGKAQRPAQRLIEITKMQRTRHLVVFALSQHVPIGAGVCDFSSPEVHRLGACCGLPGSSDPK